MLLPLALLSTVVILSTTGLAIKDSKDVKDTDVFPGVGEYLFDGTPRNWSEAFNFCTENDGYLAVINSDAEKVSIRTMMARNGAPSIHLGFHDKYEQGSFVTVKDDPIDSMCSGASQWASGFPNTAVTSHTCGKFTAAGLQNEECDFKQPTICELKPSRNFDLIPGFGYYKYHPEGNTWQEAYEVCKSEGGYLHIINSAAERDALFEKYRPASMCWVGVHRLHATHNDQFVTIFNVPLSETGFNEWWANDPTGTFITDPFVATVFNSSLATWDSTGRSNFICEMDL